MSGVSEATREGEARRESEAPPVRPITHGRIVDAGLLLVALVGLGVATLVAVRQPLWGGDYVAIWGLKAKAILRSGSLLSVFRVDPTGLASHPEYPLAWPLVLAGTATLARGWDDLVLTLLRPPLVLLAALLAARATRAPLTYRLLTAAVLTLLPYYGVSTYVGYAEALLLVFLLAALVESDRLETAGAPALFAVALGLAAFTKQEGALAGALAALLAFAAGRRRAGLLAGLAVAAAVVPWQLAVRAATGDGAKDFAFHLDLGRLATGLAVLGREVLPSLGWVAGAGLLLALAPATRRRRRGLLLGLLLYAAALVSSLLFSRLDPTFHVTTTWDRLAFVMAGLLVPVLSEAVSEARGGG